MQYLPLFLLFAAVLIAGYFYVQRAKRRDPATPAQTNPTPTRTDPEA
jgi:hypothetical protein